MSFRYSLEVRLLERLAHKKLLVLSIFSLAIAFYFVLMFLSKIEETNSGIQYFKDHFNEKYSVCILANRPDYPIDFPHTLSTERNDYISLSEGNKRVPIVFVDDSFTNFYPFSQHSSAKKKDCDRNLPPVYMGEQLARQLGLCSDDRITYNGRDYQIIALVTAPPYLKKMIFSEKYRDANRIYSAEKITLTVPSDRVREVFSDMKVISERSFQVLQEENILSLKEFKWFLIIFSMIFFIISAINVSLVIKTTIYREKENYLAQSLCGESNHQYVFSVCMDFLLISFIAYHLCILFYYVTRPFIPYFFYFSLGLKTYISEFLIIVLLTLMSSLFLARSQAQKDRLRLLRS